MGVEAIPAGQPRRWPLAVHIHCPVTFVINLETDCAGSA
jgi:hypothetical protein